MKYVWIGLMWLAVIWIGRSTMILFDAGPMASFYIGGFAGIIGAGFSEIIRNGIPNEGDRTARKPSGTPS